VRYIALGAVFIQIRWLIGQHRDSLKYIIVNALYITYIKRFYIANDKTQSSVVRRKAAFVSWLSVLFAPIWCVCLRCFGDVHLTSLAFGRVTFWCLALKQVTREVIVGWAFLPTRSWFFVMLHFAFSASYFSLLAQRISNQKKCTPASACFLRYSNCRAAIETQPGSSHEA
jgi:hypothetical protein